MEGGGADVHGPTSEYRDPHLPRSACAARRHRLAVQPPAPQLGLLDASGRFTPLGVAPLPSERRPEEACAQRLRAGSHPFVPAVRRAPSPGGPDGPPSSDPDPAGAPYAPRPAPPPADHDS